MIRPAETAALLVLCLAPLAARAGEEPPPKPKPLEFEGLLVGEKDLPEGIRIVKGIHCVSVQANTFYEMPDMEGMLPAPVRKAALSLEAEGERAGTVYVFEYEKPFPHPHPFLVGLLYGQGKRSEQHPEEVLGFGRFLLILSFPRGDPAAEWYKERLRKEYRLRAPRYRRELIPLGSKLMKLYAAKDAEAGIALIEENAEKVADSSFLQYLLGEFGVMKKDWKTAEKGYRRALELDRDLTDPLAEKIVWASLDGLGLALLVQKRLDEAAETLERARDHAKAHQLEGTSQSLYNLACTRSLQGRLDEAVVALSAAIEADPKWKASARTDPDLAKARERKDVRELLED